MGICYLVGAGDFNENIELYEDDLLIAVDGGFDALMKAGYVPDVLVGDLDSVKMQIPESVKVIKYNKEKDKSVVELTIHEGRNHQVKKMFEAIGKEVIKLHRDSFAGISSKGLYEGQSRRLTEKEIKELKKLAYKEK